MGYRIITFSLDSLVSISCIGFAMVAVFLRGYLLFPNESENFFPV